ncbi:MAG TPA: hypothetical protein ENJ66_02330, partial [Calditrichae bacterium]|nr:hypothetical protein [Calditrichia bacterium]
MAGTINATGELRGITKLSFDRGTNYNMYANSYGLVFNAGSGTADFLVYNGASYTGQLRMGYNSSALISTYDTNETLTIRANGSGNIILMDSGTGNVGIGTTSPNAKLDVAGTAKVSGDLTVDTNTLYVDSANNRVGIGTTGPTGTLHLWGPGINGADAAIYFGDRGNSTNPYIKEYGSGDSDQLVIQGRAGLFLNPNIGNVGVGTSSPTEKLTIDNGNIALENIGADVNSVQNGL